jgi:hypothetical protein
MTTAMAVIYFKKVQIVLETNVSMVTARGFIQKFS